MPEEEMNVNEDEVMDELEEDVEEEVAVDEAVIMDAVKDCFSEEGEAAGLTGDEAIDVVIAKLEGMKAMTGESMLGGLGGDTMELPEDEPVQI